MDETSISTRNDHVYKDVGIPFSSNCLRSKQFTVTPSMAFPHVTLVVGPLGLEVQRGLGAATLIGGRKSEKQLIY
jgi:hypothetical protein